MCIDWVMVEVKVVGGKGGGLVVGANYGKVEDVWGRGESILRLLSLMGYFQPFVENYGALAAPLKQRLKKDFFYKVSLGFSGNLKTSISNMFTRRVKMGNWVTELVSSACSL